jgi:hypothetical protein
MKKITIILILFIIAAGISFGQTTFDDPLFAPVLPEIIGQGGAFTANAHGYGALVTNPAGFSMKDGSFTLLSTNIAPYFLPTDEDIAGFEALLGNAPEDGIVALTDIITQNGLGANVNAGFGIVGKGLGLGIIVDGDTYGFGNTAFGASFDGVLTATGIAGYSLKLGSDNFGVNIGGDIRAMHRIKLKNIAITDMLSDTFSVDLSTGSAIALDLGAILQLGSLSLGLSVRDLGGTQFSYVDQNMDAADFDPMKSSTEAVDLDGDGETGDVYKIPMSATAGVNFHPDFGGFSFLIDPSFSFDYQHVFYAEEDNEKSFWTGVHAGTEIRVLRFMKVRAGINQGYVTAGIGAKLLFMDINASYFTREMGDFAGAQPNEGFVLEAAIRF